MNKDIISILAKKKKLTGDDIGRLLLTDMAEEFKAFRETGTPKAIMTDADFNRLLEKLEGNHHAKRYNNYVNIYNTIRLLYALTDTLQAKTLYKLCIYRQIIDNVLGAIESTIKEDESPLIMTRSQYNKVISRYEKDLASRSYNYIEIFLDSVRHYFTNYESIRNNYKEGLCPDIEEPKEDKEVEAIIAKYEEEPVKNKELIKEYKSLYNMSEKGYYTFKLGGIIETKQELFNELSKRRITPLKQKEDYTEKELKSSPDEDFVKEILTEEQIEKHLCYEKYGTAPDKVYKYDLIDGDIITDQYALCTDDKDEQLEIKRLFSLYLKELPELALLIRERMSKERIFTRFNNIKEKDLFEMSISWADLYDSNLYDYKHWLTYNLKEDYPRARNGIAIIEESVIDGYEHDLIIDKQGNFIPPEPIALIDKINQHYKEAFMSMLEKESSKGMTQGFHDNMIWIHAYNMFIDILSSQLDIPNLTYFKCPLKEIELHVEEYNNKLNYLLNIQLPAYGRHGRYDESKETREKLFKALPYIDINEQQVTQERKEKGEEYISDISHFSGISENRKPLYILMGWEENNDR